MKNIDMPAIKAVGLGKRYLRKRALWGVDLEVAQGSICALLGPNGAGKTTFLRLLAGLIRPTQGRASILGSDCQRLQPADWHRIAYVSESQELPLWMTVKDLIAYCRPLYPRWDSAFCEQLLGEFDLPMNRRLRGFSRGMRMKAALLVSLAPRPQVLLLDEPFSGLDPLVREELIAGLLDWSSQASWSVLLASHDLEEVERLADHVVFINQGSLSLNESIVSLQDRFRLVSGSVAPGTQATCSLPVSWREFRIEGGRFQFVDSQFKEVEMLDTQLKGSFSGGEVTFDAAAMGLRSIYLSEAKASKATSLGAVA